MGKTESDFLEEPPPGTELTSYDREHMVLYLRILDAERAGADWREVVRVLFERDLCQDPERCRKMHDSHLARAHWMSEQGYRELVRESQRKKPE